MHSRFARDSDASRSRARRVDAMSTTVAPRARAATTRATRRDGATTRAARRRMISSRTTATAATAATAARRARETARRDAGRATRHRTRAADADEDPRDGARARRRVARRAG